MEDREIQPEAGRAGDSGGLFWGIGGLFAGAGADVCAQEQRAAEEQHAGAVDGGRGQGTMSILGVFAL